MITPISERGYARPEVLVSTDWVASHLDDPSVRLLESDEDVLLYETGHLPEALKLDWVDELNDPVERDYIDRDAMEHLLRGKGIGADTNIVLYGDRNNWWPPTPSGCSASLELSGWPSWTGGASAGSTKTAP